MGYSGYAAPTPPRSLRVIFGFKIAVICLVFGATMVTNKYHRAMSMKSLPTEMEWQQLADIGITDNAFITLTDVQMNQADQDAFEQFMGDFGDGANAEELEAQFAAAMEDMDSAEALAMSTAPISILPIGGDESSTRRLIVIPRNEEWLTEAEYQLDEYGTLSGHVSSFSGDEFAKAVFTLFGLKDEALEERLATADKVYTLQPMREPIDREQTAWNFWLCGLGVSFGLILCCSGGPSIITCIFFMVPSVVSLLGYPMRYGRGGNFTKLVYLVIGGALASAGYKYLIVDGEFGEPNGNPLLHAVGFALLFTGFAATLSIPVQLVIRKLAASVEPPKTRKKSRRLSYEAACALTPPEPEEDLVVPNYITRDKPEPASLFDSGSDDDLDMGDSPLLDDAPSEIPAPAGTYVDGKFVESGVWGMPAELQAASESLAPMGFADPLDVQWNINNEIRPSAIQLGCQAMVVSDIEMVDGEMITRLISVLHDGMAVVTVSNNTDIQQDRRMGTSGYYAVAPSNQVSEMMSMHLQETVATAEKRDTTVVLIDNCEIQQVSLFGRRVLAEIQSQYGEIDMEVGSANYGRFNVPTKPVVDELANV